MFVYEDILAFHSVPNGGCLQHVFQKRTHYFQQVALIFFFARPNKSWMEGLGKSLVERSLSLPDTLNASQ